MEVEMALIRLELTEGQAQWLQKLLDERISDAHWSRTPVDPEDVRHTVDVKRELDSAAASAGVRKESRYTGQCD